MNPLKAARVQPIEDQQVAQEVTVRRFLERTFGWLSKFRRMAKDYEFRTENSEAMILIAASRLMVARLA